jgi:hypothetical protein
MKYSNVVRASVFGLVSAFPIAGAAQSTESLFGKQTLSVTYGPYARIELGAASPSLGDGSWLPPGSSDPQITFDVMPDKTRTAFGAIALGYDWQNGFRGDVVLRTEPPAPRMRISPGVRSRRKDLWRMSFTPR